MSNNFNNNQQESQNSNQSDNKQSQQNQQQPQQSYEEYKSDYSNIDYDNYSQQLNQIKKESEQYPLISDVTDLVELEKEFEAYPIFQKKIQILTKKYPSFRRVRRDGSCFYRAYLFQIFERIIMLQDIQLQKKILLTIEQSKKDLIKIGFEEFVLDDFYDTLIEKIKLSANENATIDELIFSDKVQSDSLVMYLRFMTSGYIKMNSILFENFIDNQLSVDQFCQIEIEPIDKEADQIQIMALVNYFNIPIQIIYLDQNQVPLEPKSMILPEGTNPEQVFITLLYRPGHYDILYSA